MNSKLSVRLFTLMKIAGQGNGWKTKPYSVSIIHIASVLHPLSSREACSFCGNCYALIRYFESRGRLLRPSMAIIDSWLTLWKAGFACRIDAVLPNLNKKQEMFSFSGQTQLCSDLLTVDNRDYLIKGSCNH